MTKKKEKEWSETVIALTLAITLILTPAAIAADSNTNTPGSTNTNTASNTNQPPNTGSSNTGGNTNQPQSAGTTTTTTITIPPERPWYEGWFTDWIGWTTPPTPGWTTTTTQPQLTSTTPTPTRLPPPTITTAGAQSPPPIVIPAAGPQLPAQPAQPSPDRLTNMGAGGGGGGTATGAGTDQLTTTGAEAAGGRPTIVKPGVTEEELRALSWQERYQLLEKLKEPQQGAAPTRTGQQPRREVTGQEAIRILEKMREEDIKNGLKLISEDLKNNRIGIDEAHQRLKTIIQVTGIQPDTKEYENALQVFRDAAQTKQVDIQRDALDQGRTWNTLSDAGKAMFTSQEEFEKAVTQLGKNRDRLIQNSADALIPVYDAISWDKLTEPQKKYFTADTKNPAPFLSARQAAFSKLTPEEKDYLTARDQYIQKDAALKELTTRRGKEKNPEERKKLDEDVNEAQKAVKAALDTYSEMQDKALGAAYRRQAEDLKTQIESLAAQADTMEEGAKKNELERKIASLTAQQQQLDFKAREATGQLTFAERLNELVTSYSEFSGLGQFSALFIDDKDMAKRRQEAEDLFCNTIMIGGTGCWTSKICKSSIDATIGGTAVVAKTASGEPRGAARIQADKSPPALIYNETAITTTGNTLYRVSYFLLNTNEKTMTYNLVFHNADGSAYRAFAKDKDLAPGASESKIRTSAIVKYSNKEYAAVCLTFNPPIVKLNGGKTKQLCSEIASYRGEATTMPGAQPTPSEQAAAGEGGGQAGTGAAEGAGAGRPPQDFDGF